ncbi:amino acid racemase [Bacillus sp. WMMC1349]|uniref:aspartate/glutamate racemase family protein n=1 Tax=Bacillus sp. WMMC1349 TaxID=2736254 RepID=UPI0015575DDB|nr:amino acid racemase [Bacillus sp. WMMC1349]NPC91370.1 amino acid racemase [Bacillus sp. WMMC1349]
MIGILAGMGPKSTGPFVNKVVDECQKIYGATYDLDFPHMMIYSCPTPFYIDQPIDHKEMERAIINGARKLEKTGVDFIAIPCTTAHIYFKSLKNAVSVPLLNMVDETMKIIPEESKKIALLATQLTIESGLYQEAFVKNGFDYIHKDSWQALVNQIILYIKSGHVNDSFSLWNKLSEELTKEVDVAVIACTDLNVVTDKQAGNLCLIDSSASLAKAIVHQYLSIKA